MYLRPLPHMPSLSPHVLSLHLVMAVMTETMSKPFLSHKDAKSMLLRVDMSPPKAQPGSPGVQLANIKFFPYLIGKIGAPCVGASGLRSIEEQGSVC